MRFFLIILFSLGVIGLLNAECLVQRDSTFIGPFAKKYALRFFVGTRHSEFSIRPNGNQDSAKISSVVYRPNVGYFFGIGGTVKHFGLNLSFRIPYSSRDDQNYGKTSFTDLRLLGYGCHYGGQIFYKKYNGFYVSNPEAVYTDWENGDSYPQRSDITLENIGAEFYYVFNKDQYSLRSVFRQTEKQLKNAHSFLIMGDVSALTIYGKSSLIPSHLEKYYGVMSGLRSGDFVISGLLGGFTSCNVIHKDFFISPTIMAGPAYLIRNYKTSSGDIYRDDLGLKVNGKIAGGYNTKDYYAGFIFETDSDIIREREMRLTSNVFFVNVFVGYRLGK